MVSLSIIIPVYKVPLEFLRECFNSLTVQTMQECEFIIVSDGAPEAECSICEEYTNKDSRFKFFKREHAGVSAARNYGIQQAKGEYISFVDADDWIDKSYTLFFSKIKTFPDIIFFSYTLHLKDRIYSNKFPQTTFVDSNSIHPFLLQLLDYQKNDLLGYTWNKFFKKSIIKTHQLLFTDNISFLEDEIFTLQYCQHISNLYIYNTELYHYRFSTRGLTYANKSSAIYHNIFAKLTDAIEFYPKNFKEVFLNKRIHFLHFLSIIKQKGILNYHDCKNFRSCYLQEQNKKYSCLTLRILFFFPTPIAYILCYFYKLIYWLPGLKTP